MWEGALLEITQMVWESYFSGSLRADETLGDHTRVAWRACIQVVGEWNGALVVGCDETLGKRCAAMLLGKGEEEVEHDDVRDVLGELANMIGGNLKSLLPGSNRLSLPAVVDGSDFALGLPGVVRACGLGLRAQDGPLVLTLYEPSPGAGVPKT